MTIRRGRPALRDDLQVEPLLEILLPDPSLVVLVGAAGSGKSTFAARHFEPAEVLSSDAYRELIAGDAADQRATRPAFAALHRAVRRRLATGNLVVVDATSVAAGARGALLRVAMAAGLPAVAIVLDPPRDVVLARNAGRPVARIVPEAAVLRQLDELARSLVSGRIDREGFANVVRLTDPLLTDRVQVRRLARAP
jgi:protein phosphatase